MTPAEELIAHVRDTVVPDKRRILRTRALAAEMAAACRDPEAGRRLAQRLNNAYLVLQLATLSDDPETERRGRAECVALVVRLDRARDRDRSPDRKGDPAPDPAALRLAPSER